MLKENYPDYRNRANKQLLKDAYNYCNDRLPFIVNNVNYYIDGDDPAEIPADYFTNPKSQLDFQLKKIRWHNEHINDNYVPVFYPWFGTTVVPSALGVPVIYPANTDPALRGNILKCPEQVKDLQKPDPYKDGQMPMVLKTIDYVKKECDLPVCVTDTQGPFNIAISLAGVENLFIWFFTNPNEAHALMEFSTQILIDWIKVQKKHAGIPINGGAFPHAIYMPKGGVAISDDDCTQVDDGIYREFVVPYNSRVLEAFGGGSIHFCGFAMHQLKALASTKGLTAVNNFCMGNFEQIYRLQDLLSDKKIALMVCDYAPSDVSSYFDKLLERLKPEGTILASYPAYSMVLDDGKYINIPRNQQQTSQKVFNYLNKKLR